MATRPISPGGMPAVAPPPRSSTAVIPNTLYVLAPGLNQKQCQMLARQAAAVARAVSPKLSGRGADGIKPYYAAGIFGVRWDRPYIWYQEQGISPFTMKTLAGKTIPMWIDDPTGAEHRKNPKAKTRVTVNGRKQILIFRKAAKLGARKRVAVRDAQGRLVNWRSVPQSYPGAPGRIARTTFHEKYGTHTGKIAKLVPRAHVGVRWRHPGIVGREFLTYSVQGVAQMAGVTDTTVYHIYRKQ